MSDERNIDDAPVEIEFPVPVTTEGRNGAMLDPRTYRRPHWCSWRTDTREGQLRSIRCTQPPDAKIEDLIGTPIPVQHLRISQEQFTSPETGEVSDSWKMTFVRPDGSTVDCWSALAMQFLATVIDTIGEPPYDPPLWVAVSSYKTRNARRAYRFHVLSEEEAASFTPESPKKRK